MIEITGKPQKGSPVVVGRATGNGGFTFASSSSGGAPGERNEITLLNGWVNVDNAQFEESHVIRWGPLVGISLQVDASSATSTILGNVDLQFRPSKSFIFSVVYEIRNSGNNNEPLLFVRPNGDIQMNDYDAPGTDLFWVNSFYAVGV